MKKTNGRGLRTAPAGQKKVPQPGKRRNHTQKPAAPAPYWAVIRTKARQERWACKNAANQGFEAYCPVLHVQGTRWTKEPMFPGYAFVRITGPWYTLLNTYGVVGPILGADGKPAAVSPALIRALKAAEKASEPKDATRLKLSTGDAVVVKYGPFAGHLVVYQGMTARQRVSALLEFMGKATPLTLSTDQIGKVQDP